MVLIMMSVFIVDPAHNKKLHLTNIAALVLCMSRSSILHKTLSAIFAGELGVKFYEEVSKKSALPCMQRYLQF